MAIENMFDQRQTKSGATLRTAFGDVDPIESFGQPRQMLGRDAGAVIAHAHARFRLALDGRTRAELDVDPPSGGAVFERVLDKIFENANQLVVVAKHSQRSGIFDIDGNAAVAR